MVMQLKLPIINKEGSNHVFDTTRNLGLSTIGCELDHITSLERADFKHTHKLLSSIYAVGDCNKNFSANACLSVRRPTINSISGISQNNASVVTSL